MKYYLEFEGLIPKKERREIDSWLQSKFGDSVFYDGSMLSHGKSTLLVDATNIDLKQSDLSEIPYKNKLRSLTRMDRMLA